jgi:hypothetical protein
MSTGNPSFPAPKPKQDRETLLKEAANTREKVIVGWQEDLKDTVKYPDATLDKMIKDFEDFDVLVTKNGGVTPNGRKHNFEESKRHIEGIKAEQARRLG